MGQLSGTQWHREVCRTVARELAPLVELLEDVGAEGSAADLRRVRRLLEAKAAGWPMLTIARPPRSIA